MQPPAPSGPPPQNPLTGETDYGAAETRPIERPTAGERHFHHYEICLQPDGLSLFELGRGAMGVSYKARDVNLDVFVAIKVIRETLPGQLHARERFRREARAAARLRHPNVASVFHFGETAAGEVFYAMEFVEGETLAARVRRDGPFAAAMVIEIGLQVTAALIAADEHGLVHRDLKPANIMLESMPVRPGTATPLARQIRVKVIDFGLAKAAANAGLEVEEPLTNQSGFLGTPAYASPEQAEGGAVDARSDIYSLGATLWYLLTGKVPFPGRTFSEIYDRQMNRALPVAQLSDTEAPSSFVDLLKSMLSPSASKRPASPAQLYEALESCRQQIGTAAAGDVLPPRRSRWSRATMVTLGLLATVLLFGTSAALYLRSRSQSTATAPSAPLEKSIAVLPLEDLSEDKANGYFADGIQDDLLSNLAKIKALKVISRSSVMSYRDTARRNLREIGQRLGVTTILEGSVRRAPDRVLVNVSLTDVRDGRELWSERYDRTLADSITLQGELATEIAAALRATLTPEEKAQVEDKPTNNPDAYVLYLRAREYQTLPVTLLQDFQTAERLYRQALDLDPGFALAHARLSATLSYMYLTFLPTEEVRQQARAHAEEALRLRPDSGDGHLARALCLYWTQRDYPAALSELKTAGELLPGNAEIDLMHGAIRRRQGRWTESLANMRRALTRDPLSARTAREIMYTGYMLRDWPIAAKDGARAVAIAPDNAMMKVEKSCEAYWSRGDLKPLRDALAAMPAGQDPDGNVTLFRWDTALLSRDFAGAEGIVKNSALETFVTTFGAVLPKSFLLGCAQIAQNRPDKARPLFEAALPAMEKESQAVPLDPFRQAYLGILYAFLGRNDDALRLGRRATELSPESKDACIGPVCSALLAEIYARLGMKDEAVKLIEHLLQTPGALSTVFEGSMTIADLRMRWQWDPLRDDPRFQKLIAGTEPKTVY